MAAPAFAHPQTGLHLDAASHTYTFNGRPVPGVTATLKAAGLIDYSGIPQSVLDRAAERGKAVHLALQYLDYGTLDFDSVCDELRGYVRAYQSFLADSGAVCGLIEYARYQADYGYAGMLDRTFVWGNDPVILDFKTGVIQEGHFAQLVAYGRFFPSPRRFRHIPLQLMPNGRYRVYEVPFCKAEYYWTLFRKALASAQTQIEEGEVLCNTN